MTSTRIGGLAVLGTAVAFAGCGGGSPAQENNGGNGVTRAQRVVVTRDNPDLPAGCRPRSVGRVVSTFSAALGGGDQAELRRLWGGRFVWFTVGGPRSARSVGPLVRPTGGARGATRTRRAFDARSPEAALHYVERPQDFQMRLTELQVHRRPRGGSIGVSYYGRWREQGGDKPGTYRLEGKGEINCGDSPDGQSIRVWSMGVNAASRAPPPICPRQGPNGSLTVCWVRK